jgi:diaminopimelate decarboxylase
MPTPAPERLAQLVARLGTVEGGELVVGGHPISALAAQVGTPFYLYRGEVVLAQVAAFRQALGPTPELFYSVKANPSLGLCQLLARAGVGVELASLGELELARAAGFATSRMLLAGPGKSGPELAAAVRLGLGAVNVESLGELARLVAEARAQGRRPTVCLRLNPKDQVLGSGMRMGGGPTQFGLDEEQLPDAVALALAAGDAVDLAGLHVYAGSQMTDVEALLQHCEHVLELAERMAGLGVAVRLVDLGGGFAVPVHEGAPGFDLETFGRGFQARVVARARASGALCGARLLLELGRWLVAEAGLYVTRILDVKQSRGTTYAVADGGMHHHLGATGNLGQVFKKAYPMAVLSRLGAPAAAVATVVGPCCTPLDQFGAKVALAAVEPGELLGVFISGAYGLSASSLGFLSHPTPAEVLVHRGEVHVLREAGPADAVVRAQRPLP